MIVRTKNFPFGRYVAINIFGIIFSKVELTPFKVNHENIHSAQMKELLWIPFYLLYGIEWLIRRLTSFKDNHTIYRNLSFEKEAYANELNLNYLDNRKHFSWIKYIWN